MKHFQFTRMFRLLAGLQLNFGGEQILGRAPDGANWHHEGITRQAADSWSPEARNALAFHADYLDSYQYNPLWWADPVNGGGLGRLKVALSTQRHLANLHCDDLFDADTVERAHRRYLSGTVCGLVWALESDLSSREKISCAHNLIGVSLHAIQDFYAHSNWIDVDWRRTQTWFDLFPDDRRRDGVYTGHYEAPAQGGIKPHGEVQLDCALLRRFGLVREALGVACHAASPLSNLPLCDMYQRCEDALPIDIPLIDGVQTPEGIGYVTEGINLDSRWQAPLGVATRGADMQPPMNSEEAFTTAYNLAVRASRQWLEMLGRTMESIGYRDFWDQITTTGVSDADYKADTGPFERMDLLPYLFLSAGAYPPPRGDYAHWYLRLRIKTADTDNAGTDGPIVPIVNGIKYRALNYGIRSDNPALSAAFSHNDFERNSVATYMVGPFDGPPDEFTLRNEAPSLGQLFDQLYDRFVEFIDECLQEISDALLSIIAGHADKIAGHKHIFRPEDLEAIPEGGELPFEIDCDGGSEGHYSVKGSVMALSHGAPLTSGYATRRYRINFATLHALEESKFDRGSGSDEPFVIGMVVAHGGSSSPAWRTRPYSDVDTGEVRGIDISREVEVPVRYGFITLPVIVFEHDDESDDARRQLLSDFRDEWYNRTRDHETGFIELIGQALAPTWHCESIDVFAFQRGETIQTANYRTTQVDRHVGPGEQVIVQPWFLNRVRGHVLDRVLGVVPIIRPGDIPRGPTVGFERRPARDRLPGILGGLPSNGSS